MLIIFNAAGYRFVLKQMEVAASSRVEERIDNRSYREDELVEVAIPLQMPYYTDRGSEEAYGEMIYKGQLLRFVKRSIRDNVLYLLCLPDKEKTRLQAAEQHWQQPEATAGNAKNHNSRSLQLLKLLLENNFLPGSFYSDAGAVTVAGCRVKIFPENIPVSFPAATPGQPPERIS